VSLRKIISKNQYRRATWKNGLGYTDEIAIHPEGADFRRGDFNWRMSSARIEQASAFSVFPDHDRVLVILSGHGIRLFHRFEEGEPEEAVELPPFSSYEFPGDIQSRCELIDGGVRDLSVFIRKGANEAQVRTIELAGGAEESWIPQGRWNFVFAAVGNFSFESGRVDEGDCFFVELDRPSEEPIGLRASAEYTRLVLVEIQG
jgi:environmental stress-induced protein Ves